MRFARLKVAIAVAAIVTLAGATGATATTPPDTGCVGSGGIEVSLDNDTTFSGAAAESALEIDVPANETLTCGQHAVATAVGTAIALPLVTRKQFTSGARTFTKSDANGTFNAQYTPTNTSIAWSFAISPVLRAVAIGPVTATVDRTPPNCRYFTTGAASATSSTARARDTGSQPTTH